MCTAAATRSGRVPSIQRSPRLTGVSAAHATSMQALYHEGGRTKPRKGRGFGSCQECDLCIAAIPCKLITTPRRRRAESRLRSRTPSDWSPQHERSPDRRYAGPPAAPMPDHPVPWMSWCIGIATGADNLGSDQPRRCACPYRGSHPADMRKSLALSSCCATRTQAAASSFGTSAYRPMHMGRCIRADAYRPMLTGRCMRADASGRCMWADAC
jgi:hypothetical protein